MTKAVKPATKRMMTEETTHLAQQWRLLRISWPMLGGIWGAWVGFGGCFRLAHSADSFGSFLATGAFAVFALIGLVAGAACGALIGGLVNDLVNAVLRRTGSRWGSASGEPMALVIATLATAMAIWQLGSLVQARYPGLHAGLRTQQATPVVARPESTHPVRSSKAAQTTRAACAEPPPAQSRERVLWEAEGR